VYWLVLSAVSGLATFWLHTHDDVDLAIAMTACANFLKLVMLLLPLVTVAYLWKRAPTKVGDRMMIEEEFNITCDVLCCSFVSYIGCLVLMALGFTLAQHTALGLSWIFTSAAPSLVATVWMPGRLSKRTVADFGTSLRPELVLEKGLFKDRDVAADGSRTNNVHGELAILFANEAKMKALGCWMMKSFAGESFLCFIEMVQFKERAIAAMAKQNPTTFDELDVVRQCHRLYKCCPKSSIVFNYEKQMKLHQQLKDEEAKERTSIDMTVICDQFVLMRATDDGVLEQEDRRSLRQCAQMIYEKYVDSSAALSINIGYELYYYHHTLHQENYASLTPMQWVTLYDDVLAVLEGYIVQCYISMIRALKRNESD